MNFIKKIGDALKAAGSETLKILTDTVSIGEKVLSVVKTYEAVSPAFRQQLSQILTDCGTIVTAVSPAIASGGTNVAIDLSTIPGATEAVLKLVADLIAFLPTLTAALKAIDADVKS
jgi:hypothetical protein